MAKKTPTERLLKVAKSFAATHAVKLSDKQHRKFVEALASLLIDEKEKSSMATAKIAAEWGFRQGERGVSVQQMHLNLRKLREG